MVLKGLIALLLFIFYCFIVFFLTFQKKFTSLQQIQVHIKWVGWCWVEFSSFIFINILHQSFYIIEFASSNEISVFILFANLFSNSLTFHVKLILNLLKIL